MQYWVEGLVSAKLKRFICTPEAIFALSRVVSAKAKVLFCPAH
jgi:hypothetical protein